MCTVVPEKAAYLSVAAAIIQKFKEFSVDAALICLEYWNMKLSQYQRRGRAEASGGLQRERPLLNKG